MCACVCDNQAGFVETVWESAFENVKVRMQAGNQHLYRGTFDCIAAVLRDEGAAALYRGFNAHCLRNMLWWVRAKHINMHNVWVVRHEKRFARRCACRPLCACAHCFTDWRCSC